MFDAYWGSEPKEAEKAESNGNDNGSGMGDSENRIYFYSEVNRDRILELNQKIQQLNVDMVTQQMKLNLKDPPPIYLNIHSYGGSIFAGLAGMDEIVKSKVPIETVIDGGAASAATFLSVVGGHRTINRNAYMLIHQLSSVTWGKFEEIKDDVKNLGVLMKTIRNIYRKHAKIPEKKLKEILKHDLWWDAKKCKEYGLVDEII
jgi:ATP-dependent Clp endopeptidase proteolytic subunit ClpP